MVKVALLPALGMTEQPHRPPLWSREALGWQESSAFEQGGFLMKVIASGIAVLSVVPPLSFAILPRLLLNNRPRWARDAVRPDATTDQQHQHQMMEKHGQSGQIADGTTPTMPGQDAFGAIQEIVRLLEADPNTDVQGEP
jgi:hypothetical protein